MALWHSLILRLQNPCRKGLPCSILYFWSQAQGWLDNKSSEYLPIESKSSTVQRLRPSAYSIWMDGIGRRIKENKENHHNKYIQFQAWKMVCAVGTGSEVSLTHIMKTKAYHSPGRPPWTSQASRSSCWPRWYGTFCQSRSECTSQSGCCCHCVWFWRSQWPGQNHDDKKYA